MITCICPVCGTDHNIEPEDFGTLIICECGCEFDSSMHELIPEEIDDDITDLDNILDLLS